MKKVIFVLTAWGCIVLMSVVCSCGNGSKPQVNEQSIKDSITKAVKDSMEKIEAEKVYNKMHSKESMEKDLKSFLSEYVNTTNDNIEEYLSSDFNAVITKWTNNPNMGEWNLFGLNSSSMVERYTIQNLEGTENNKAKADVLLSIDNEGDYQEETCSIYMVYEKDKWVVDEIDNVKKDGIIVGYRETMYCYVLGQDGGDGYINMKFTFQRYKDVGKSYTNVKGVWPMLSRINIIPKSAFGELKDN